MRMKMNVENMLRQAGALCRVSDDWHGGGYDHSLQELSKHLRELRDRYADGDEHVVDEFFDLYIFSDDQVLKPLKPKEPPCPTP